MTKCVSAQDCNGCGTRAVADKVRSGFLGTAQGVISFAVSILNDMTLAFLKVVALYAGVETKAR